MLGISRSGEQALQLGDGALVPRIAGEGLAQLVEGAGDVAGVAAGDARDVDPEIGGRADLGVEQPARRRAR